MWSWGLFYCAECHTGAALGATPAEKFAPGKQNKQIQNSAGDSLLTHWPRTIWPKFWNLFTSMALMRNIYLYFGMDMKLYFNVPYFDIRYFQRNCLNFEKLVIWISSQRSYRRLISISSGCGSAQNYQVTNGTKGSCSLAKICHWASMSEIIFVFIMTWRIFTIQIILY